MTGPHKWDPSVLDFAYANRKDWEILGDDRPPYEEDWFNAYGKSTQCIIANLELLLDDPPAAPDPSISDHTSTLSAYYSALSNDTFHTALPYWTLMGNKHSIDTSLEENQHSIETQEPDWESLHPYFGYQPIEAIKATWKVTTRHGGERTNTYMRKHYKSCNPVLNVHRRNEPVAADIN